MIPASHSYGYCPKCGAPGLLREKRPFGDDTCDNGHKYPSSSALNLPRVTDGDGNLTTDQLNERFEVEFASLCPNKSLLKLSAGQHVYQDSHTQTMWEFFKRGYNLG